jgi:hypothetical protein
LWNICYNRFPSEWIRRARKLNESYIALELKQKDLKKKGTGVKNLFPAEIVRMKRFEKCLDLARKYFKWKTMISKGKYNNLLID